MELSATTGLMLSSNYKYRFLAEYMQTKERYSRLHKMIVRYEANTLNFTPTCSIDLLKRQAKAMGEYLYTLELRAEIEGISLPEYDVVNKNEIKYLGD